MKSHSIPGQLALFESTEPSGERRADPLEIVLRDLAAGLPPHRLARLSHTELSCVLLRFGTSARSLQETGAALGLLRPQALVIERRAIRALAEPAVPGGAALAQRVG